MTNMSAGKLKIVVNFIRVMKISWNFGTEVTWQPDLFAVCLKVLVRNSGPFGIFSSKKEL